MHVLFALFLLPFGAIHFLPTIIALLRRGRSTFGIFMLNLFLGWTLIGWVVALVWAIKDEPKFAYGYPYAPSPYRRY